MKIATDVLNVLDQAEADGNALRLVGQLDRKLYEQTNRVLVEAGGKWNRSAKAHLFTGSAADAIEQIVLTGEVATRADFGYFPTPVSIVKQLVDLADLRPGLEVLEPSAGQGAISKALADADCLVDCIELQEANASVIYEDGYARGLIVGDFLAMVHAETDSGYDRIIMNPPFAKQQDIRHVTHALGFLRPGGLLVAVMSNGVTFRQNQATRDFNALLAARGGRVVPLPDDAFRSSGTGVRTIVAVIPAVAKEATR